MTNDKRVAILKEILLELHHGASPESVQDRFNEHFSDVSAIEIALMEQKLVFNDDNDITYEDVLELCNVHANLFKDKVNDSTTAEADLPGHPVRVYKNENAALQGALMRVNNILNELDRVDLNEEPGILRGLLNQYKLIGQFDKHYDRKENVFFPFLEKYGYDAPPKVMWAKDDEIRDLYKTALKDAEKLPNDTTVASVRESFAAFEFEFKEMIFKEEAILLNLLLEALTSKEWYQIAQESDIYGYTIIPPEEEWVPDWLNDKTSDELTLADIKTKMPNYQQTQTIEPQPVSVQQPMIQTQQTSSIEAYHLPLSNGKLIVNYEPANPFASRANVNYNHVMHTPFTHGYLSLNNIQWLFDYLPFKVYFFDRDGIYQFTNAKETTLQLPIYADLTLGKLFSSVYQAQYLQLLTEMITAFRNNEQTLFSFYHESDGIPLHTQFIGIYNDFGEYIGFMQVDEDITDLLTVQTPMSRTIDPIDVNAQVVSLSDVVADGNVTLPTFESRQVVVNGGIITLTFQGNQQQLLPEDASVTQRFALNQGTLTLEEINGLFNALQGEITFVDEHANFTYYNDHVPTDDMFFKRNPAQLNRDLEFCHPPKLWPMVHELVTSFELKQKQSQTIWFTKSSGELVHIVYRPLFDGEMHYRGVLEIVRDIKEIQKAKNTLPGFVK